MPRVTNILPPTADALPAKPLPTIELPGEGYAEQQDIPAGETPAGEPVTVNTEEMRPLTILLLGIICKIAKGDEPTEREIDLVNPPLCMVANKYNLSNRWTAELALFGSVLIVVTSSRRRAAARFEQTQSSDGPPLRDRAEDPIDLHQFKMQDEEA